MPAIFSYSIQIKIGYIAEKKMSKIDNIKENKVNINDIGFILE